MAITVGTPTTARTGGGFSETLTIAAPSGLAGVLDLVFAGGTENIDLLAASLTNDGTAFTEVLEEHVLTSAPYQGIMLVGRKTGAATPGDTVFTLTGPYANQALAAARFPISGADMASPVDVISPTPSRGQVSGNPNQARFTIGSITTTKPCLVMAWALARARSDDNPLAYAAITGGWTVRAALQSFYHDQACSLGVFSMQQSVAGATGALEVDLNNWGADSNYYWMGGMLAIAPAAAGATGPAGAMVNTYGF